MEQIETDTFAAGKVNTALNHEVLFTSIIVLSLNLWSLTSHISLVFVFLQFLLTIASYRISGPNGPLIKMWKASNRLFQIVAILGITVVSFRWIYVRWLLCALFTGQAAQAINPDESEFSTAERKRQSDMLYKVSVIGILAHLQKHSDDFAKKQKEERRLRCKNGLCAETDRIQNPALARTLGYDQEGPCCPKCGTPQDGVDMDVDYILLPQLCGDV